MPLKTYTALLNQSGSGNIIPITSSGDYGVTYYRTDTGSYYFSVAFTTGTSTSVDVQLNSFILSGSTYNPLYTDIQIYQISGSLSESIYNIFTYDITLPQLNSDEQIYQDGTSILSDNKFDYINTGVTYVLQINEVESYLP
jgi:hypothetical protein